MDKNYQACNHLLVQTLEKSIGAGAFEVDLQIPENCSGRYVLSAYVYGEHDWSAGAEKLVIRKPQ
jgi:hypothetical protein